ncbi:MAG: type II toxin-antitoxin system HicB family antitoxin [Calditrichaeota bacterium]|nr:type II toxin-antitoxin system HicB family antitoxin [Calditrichota bacterium]
MSRQFVVYVEWDAESKMYVGTVPGLHGAHSQGETLDELQKNMQEVVELVLEDLGEELDNLPVFVGLQTVAVAG